MLSFEDLNMWYSYVEAYNIGHGVPRDAYVTYPNYIIVTQLPLKHFVERYESLNMNDICNLCDCHGLSVRGHNKTRLFLALLRHDCSLQQCEQTNYVFKSRSRPNRSRGLGSRSTAFQRSETELNSMLMNSQENARARRVRLSSVHLNTTPSQESAHQPLTDIGAIVDERLDLTSDMPSESFPKLQGRHFRNGIIREWQESMDPDKWSPTVCSVCGQDKTLREIRNIDFTDEQLSVLVNEYIPDNVLPDTYNLLEYKNAILHPKGLSNCALRSTAQVCHLCYSSLRLKKQPLNALANFQYYGWEKLPDDVRNAFEHATLFDLMLVSRARCSRITHLFSSNKQSPVYGSNPETSQRYNRGNVAIFPQNSAQLLDFLPPNCSQIEQDMCALFIGGTTVPTKDNIKHLNPVLVSKNRVYTMIKFLTENNSWYMESGTRFSEENFQSLFPNQEVDEDEIVAPGFEINHLNTQQTNDDSLLNNDSTRINDERTADADSPLLMESVGYTNVGGSSVDCQSMKNNALAWCLNNRPFVAARTSTGFLRDDDPGLLSYAFPHLDPWGICGFNNPRADEKRRLPFQKQLKNLLLQHKSPFEEDANFAFVCWNIIQKTDVRRKSCFSIKKRGSRNIAEQMRVLAPIFEKLAAKWERNMYACPEGDDEVAAVNLLNSLKMVNRDLKGSLGYKLSRRNEVRALIKKFSTPALFITLNPHDISHPLLGVIGGFTVAKWQSLSVYQRSCFVAKHPAIAARFFDAMISSFVSIVLRPDHNDGYFGKCKAYYGMVEAQGRGTLHCHMLIWLDGNPSPMDLRERLRTNEDFKSDLFRWLEFNICTHIPGSENQDANIQSSNTVRPDPPVLDPRLASQPRVADFDNEEDFELAFQMFVKDLVLTCNWHEHTHTCWKHLKNDEPHDDAHCRMRINGQTRSLTEIDPETESILLRRLHPRINNFNELVIFLMQCNMDIKYIGSGEAAKALVYYITDYITKQDLPTHVGFSALQYAMQRTSKDFWNSSTEDSEKLERSVIIRCINALNARQEVSHQQVMSYLVGGGDFYSSHKFGTLKWMDYVRHLRNEEQLISENNDTDVNDELDDLHVTITVEDGQVTASSPVLNYVYRAELELFNSMSLWEFHEKTKTMPIGKQQAGSSNAEGRRGRPTAVRGPFGHGHPKANTHQSQLKRTFVIPVLIGPALPRPDRGDEEYEEWCRLMLMFFKPWRTLSDLNGPNDHWIDSFVQYQFKEEHVDLMKNMNVENECKDARDNHRARTITIDHSTADNTFGQAVTNTGSIESFILADDNLSFLQVNSIEIDNGESSNYEADQESGSEWNDLLKGLDRIGLFAKHPIEYVSNVSLDAVYASFTQDQLQMQAKLMAEFKRHKRLRGDEDDVEQQLHSQNNLNYSVRQHTVTVNSHTSSLHSSSMRLEHLQPAYCSYAHVHENRICLDLQILDSIVEERGLKDNTEQMRALKSIGEHVIYGDRDPLLLYVAGVGGTGKSYIIQSISSLFDKLGRSEELIITAPTGSAAVLINGFTIHSILQLQRATRILHAGLPRDVRACTSLPTSKYLHAGSYGASLQGRTHFRAGSYSTCVHTVGSRKLLKMA